jgi:hypothetical protein
MAPGSCRGLFHGHGWEDLVVVVGSSVIASCSWLERGTRCGSAYSWQRPAGLCDPDCSVSHPPVRHLRCCLIWEGTPWLGRQAEPEPSSPGVNGPCVSCGYLVPVEACAWSLLSGPWHIESPPGFARLRLGLIRFTDGVLPALASFASGLACGGGPVEFARSQGAVQRGPRSPCPPRQPSPLLGRQWPCAHGP